MTELTPSHTLAGGRDDQQCQVKMARGTLRRNELSVLQASACVWVAAESLASAMHDAGKRWEPSTANQSGREQGSLLPVLHLWNEALTRCDDKRANRWPLRLQPNRPSTLLDGDSQVTKIDRCLLAIGLLLST